VRRVVGVVALVATIAAAVLLARSVPPPVTVPPAFEERPTATVTPTPSPTGPRAFALTLTERQLTDAAAASFPQTVSGVTVSDPVVTITPRDVRLLASARFIFGATQFAMVGLPYAEDGGVAVRVDSVTLGGVALPDSARESIAASVRRAIADLVPPSARVERISLGSGTMTIEGVARG
jgi:hypothetical protein